MPATTSLHVITSEELRELADTSAEPALSIYLPTERTNVQPAENSLRLRGLLDNIRSSLTDRQLRKPGIDDLLGPVTSLLDQRDFWMEQQDGLAIFRTKDMFRVYQLPVTLPEAAYVSNNLVIKPLLGAASPLGEYFILALAQGGLRFFRCTRRRIEEIDLSLLDIPLDLEESIRYVDLERQDIEHPTGTGPARAPKLSTGGGRGEESFHGHGESDPDRKTRILQWFKEVDPGIRKLIEGSGAPLITAGVDHLHPLYREANNYPHLSTEVIEGNAEGVRPDELLEKASPIMDKHLSEAIAGYSERFGDLGAHGKAGTELDDILAAAFEGRVATLFIGGGAEAWGIYDPATRTVTRAEGPQAGAAELYDLAARRTILASGDAYLLSEEEMFGGTEIAALYRY